MSGPGSRFKGKHSLDSDEEDEGEEANSVKYNILDSDDVEGLSCHPNTLGRKSPFKLSMPFTTFITRIVSLNTRKLI